MNDFAGPHTVNHRLKSKGANQSWTKTSATVVSLMCYSDSK
ncbi:mCG1033012, isoform CRA_a [Mus musculus]|nr:mCG1033012, isoform CRA_a [Mus musculus]EDL18357.1 mCG1033012, isoform CRA_a [Mus musculus]EDL18358.1 mCG1033012, isoform CRA_a [Mus musculus]